MAPRIALWLASMAAMACGTGLSSSIDAGSGPGGLGAPTCMRKFSDAVSVPVPSGQAEFSRVVGLAFDSDRGLHVLNRSASDEAFVDVLAPAPSYPLARSFGKDVLHKVRDLAVDSTGQTWVVEDFSPSGVPIVTRFDALGAQVATWKADASDQRDGLSIALDGEGLVNLGGEGRIYRYQLNGAFVDGYGVYGTGPGQILFPTGLAWDASSSSIWVADLFLNQVERYTPGQSTQRAVFGGRGTAAGKFDGNEPTGNTFYGPNKIAVDAEGKIYALDPFASRLQKFAPNGGVLNQFSFDGATQLGAIAIDRVSGLIYVGRGAAIDIICPL
jgi:tripartite motif-containing protein 71